MDSLIKRSWEISQDINGKCSTIIDLMGNPDKYAECCGLMRSLFVTLQATVAGAELCISHSLLQCVIQMAQSSAHQKTSMDENECILCHMIVSELLSETGHSEFVNQILNYEDGNQNLMYMIQGNNTEWFTSGLLAAHRWLQSQEFEKQKYALAFVTAMFIQHTQIQDLDTITKASENLSGWLSAASIKQASNPYAVNPFRKDENSALLEIDGTPSTNFFTVFNIGQYYTEDQLMNIFSFSLLLKWFLSMLQLNSSTEQKYKLLGTESSDSGILNHSLVKNSLALIVPQSEDYCFKIIDQGEKKVKVESDTEFQVACVVEAIQVLDTICILNKNRTARVFQEVKRFNKRLIQDMAQTPVMTYILQFLLHHSTSVVHDPQETFKYFFLTLIFQEFKDLGIMYDTVEFLLKNLKKISETTDILTNYFPNLFKILAWHPRIFLQDFAFLIPAIMNRDTSVEIFHLILDLPCMSAALEVMERAKKIEQHTVTVDTEPSTSLEAFFNPHFRPLFSYITRCASGQGDTINRLAHLHTMLRDCLNSTRIMVCCQLVPVLLRIWFETVMISEDVAFISQILPVVTERSGLMLGVPELIKDVHKVFAEKLLVMCKTFPEIIARQYLDLCEFLQTTANLAGRVTIYNNLIYAVGEYSSHMNCLDCTTQIINKYYESLEVVIYELMNQLGSQNCDSSIPQMVSALMSALSKLASRAQDLIPRAILCLTKVAKQQNDLMLNTLIKDFLTNKAKSLIALLKDPSSASSLLSSRSQVNSEGCHINNTNMASVIRGMQRLVSD